MDDIVCFILHKQSFAKLELGVSISIDDTNYDSCCVSCQVCFEAEFVFFYVENLNFQHRKQERRINNLLKKEIIAFFIALTTSRN